MKGQARRILDIKKNPEEQKRITESLANSKSSRKDSKRKK